MYTPGVGVCALFVILKSTRIFLPSISEQDEVLLSSNDWAIILPESVMAFLASVASSNSLLLTPRSTVPRPPSPLRL